MTVWHTALILLVIWAITFALRAAPLVATRWLRDNEFVRDIGGLLPVGVMVILALYTVRDVTWLDFDWLAPVVGVAVTILLHLWRNNVFVSLVGGIVAYAAVFFAIA